MLKFWESVKNFAALIGLIAIIIQGYIYISDNTYDLQAYADTNEYYTSRKLTNELIQIHNIGIDAGEETKELIDNAYDSFSTFSYQTIISISNKGDNVINDIQLLTNGIKSSYQFTDSEGVFQSGVTNRKIPLGNLLSNEQIEVVVWHRTISNREFSITFPEGSFEIEYSKKFNGIVADVASFIANFYFIPLIMVGAYFIVRTFEFILVSSSKNETEKSEDDG